MADNLKPYDPNKGFISFRLNPDAIKEALIEQVPYNRTLRHIYNNPEGDIRETAKVAASETPILGSLLAGEPVDAAKEAFLFGLPIKAPAKFKKEISKLPKTTQFRQEGETTVRAYDPKSRDSWRVLLDMDGNGKVIKDNNYNPANFTSRKAPTYNASQVNEFIDQSNNLHKLNKNNRLNFETNRFEELNPYDFDRLDDPKFTSTIEGKLLKEGDELSTRYSGGDIRVPNLERRLNRQAVANLVTPNLKKGESLYTDQRGNLFIRDKKGTYWWFNNDPNGKIIERGTWQPVNPAPYSDPMLNKELKDWQADVKLYNAKYGDEDSFINFKDSHKWQDDVYNARDAYYNSIYGPFYEDIMGLNRMY